MNFALKLVNCVLKMMNFVGAAPGSLARGRTYTCLYLSAVYIHAGA